jgi:hypothetical protein
VTEHNKAMTVFQQPEHVLQLIEMMGTAYGQKGLPGCTSAGQGKALALACWMRGIDALEFAERYHIVDGRPCKQATALLAEFEAAGGVVEWLDIGDSGKEARARFKYKNHNMEIAYTAEEGKRQVGAKFDKPNSNWQSNLGSMLRARLITKALRIVASDVITGMYDPTELKEALEREPVREERQRQTEKPVKVVSAVVVEDKPEPSLDDALDAAVTEGSMKEMEAKGQALLKDNPQEQRYPSKDNGQDLEKVKEELSPLGPATQDQLQEMKELILKQMEVDKAFKGKFDRGLKKLGVESPRDMNQQQAEEWLVRLRQLVEATV